ncbi:hypothetical protein NX029_01430 [Cytobacillus firmus]|nr:hypothetical protein [Cytobacillus firmus]
MKKDINDGIENRNSTSQDILMDRVNQAFSLQPFLLHPAPLYCEEEQQIKRSWLHDQLLLY